MLVLIFVAALGVSSSLILRELIVRDFGQLTEGSPGDGIVAVLPAEKLYRIRTKSAIMSE